MKSLLLVTFLFISVRLCWAGESSLTVTFQPLDGLGAGDVVVSQVTCHDWSAHSGMATAIDLISAKNVPPSNNPKEATQDLNLASRCGVGFGASDLGDPKAKAELIMDVTEFDVTKGGGYEREEIIRASLECLRRCLPEKLVNVDVTLRCVESERGWLEKIVAEFNAHDRTKVFYKQAE